MASTAVLDTTIEPRDIERWQVLFGFSAEKAQRELEAYRSDLLNSPVSEEHWDLVKGTKALEGFSVEAYSYSLKIVRTSHKPRMDGVAAPAATYIFKLDAPLDTPEKV